MKNTGTRIITLLFVIAFLSFVTFGQKERQTVTISEKAGAFQDLVDNNSIAGTWYVYATPDGGEPFRGLITFTEGGGLIASAQGDNLLNINSLATAGHGAWERVGNREFRFTFRQIFYTPDGSYDGGNRIRHVAVMNKQGTEWTGQLTVEIFNANDEVVFVGTGSGTATRIVPLPLLPQ